VQEDQLEQRDLPETLARGDKLETLDLLETLELLDCLV
jgi:hypothetical protein